MPKTLPARSEVAPGDTWDLSSLYPSDAPWEDDLKRYATLGEGYSRFKNRLSESAAVLLEMFEFDKEVDLLAERLSIYAFLRTTEDQTNSHYQGMMGRFQSIASRIGQEASYIRPEILTIDAGRMQALMDDPSLADYRLVLERIVRNRPHTLSESEERLLAMQAEMSQSARKAFRQLNDADLRFGKIIDDRGEEVELSNATFVALLHNSDRRVRREAFDQYYREFQEHENTFAATLAGSVHTDVYYAKARKHPSARQAALFPDNVPETVYDNLVTAVRESLPAVHRYFELRRKRMGLDDLHFYDTYVPIVADHRVDYPWDRAVDVILESLEPLGREYVDALSIGLRGRWCDRYPNRGKQSGAFSCGSYAADPFIMMNYKSDVLSEVFTLTHEAGHSMHSFYSSKHQPFQYYNYTIFVAEVASNFNEQLLSAELMKRYEDDPKMLASILNHEVDSIRASIVRQTMFAEFEQKTHEMAEAGEALTVASFRQCYRGLLDAYLGPPMTIDDSLELECFRIPHFYRAFYVYKYATGLSAAIALSRRVLEGGESERRDYLNFLSAGCSKDPLDLLRDAGVDMETTTPVAVALQHFSDLVDRLDETLSRLDG